MPACVNRITAASRGSKLAKCQVIEVLQELRHTLPEVKFDLTTVATAGDKDRKTSLKGLPPSDFFTKEVDELVLSGQCRIAIHSAKDLPVPVHPHLEIIALTRCISSDDALVMRAGESLATLPQHAKIATSSHRREEAVKALRSDVRFIDTRGTIEERLAALSLGKVDGVVIAEAALIRLELTYLNRVLLPGPTAQHQGQLAILAKKDDDEIRELFSLLDVRKR